MQETSYLPIICENHPSFLQMIRSGEEEEEEEAQNQLLNFLGWIIIQAKNGFGLLEHSIRKLFDKAMFGNKRLRSLYSGASFRSIEMFSFSQRDSCVLITVKFVATEQKEAF